MPQQQILNHTTGIRLANGRMRGILIDWLIKVHCTFELREETLFLTVNLIDRFLVLHVVTRKRLQLVGVTALLLACSMIFLVREEFRRLSARDGHTFTKCEAYYKYVSVVLIDIHCCSLDSKIRHNLDLESQKKCHLEFQCRKSEPGRKLLPKRLLRIHMAKRKEMLVPLAQLMLSWLKLMISVLRVLLLIIQCQLSTHENLDTQFGIVSLADRFQNKAILLIHFSFRCSVEEIEEAISKLPSSFSGRIFALTEGI